MLAAARSRRERSSTSTMARMSASTMAFCSTAPVLLPGRRNRVGVCAGSRRVAPRRTPPRCSSQQPPEREIAPENDALQRELRAKVKELFGGAENVTIAVNTDSPEFTVRRAPDGVAAPSEYRQAAATVASIAVLSVVAGLLFAYLYYNGAVHGSPQPDHTLGAPSSARRYDPYTLLGRDVDTL